MDLRHVARLSDSRRDLTDELAKSDSRGDMELAESLRPTLKVALESLRLLYDDANVWQAAAQAVDALDISTRQLVERAANYTESLPVLLELFGYQAPPEATKLVGDAVASLRAVPADEGPADARSAIEETRQALGQLLEKTRNLENAKPWQLPGIAAETIPALDMAVMFAGGALTSGVMVAIGPAALLATAAGGPLAVAPLLITGGVHLWLRKRRKRARNEELLALREQLALDLVPGARGAVLGHLDAILGLDQRASSENPQILLDLSDDLQALIDITRRFGASGAPLRTAARQRVLRGGDALDLDFLEKLPQVFATALKAKSGLESTGQIDPEVRAELKKQWDIIKNLRSRFPPLPPNFRPNP